MSNVFISHRGSDTTEAERLARDLSSRGHSIWLDAEQLTIGDSIVGKINAGLTGSSYLVLCYSQESPDSPWFSREWMSTLARQLNGAGVKILPVRLTGTRTPAILADIKYADLVKDWDSGLADLLIALK
jgi:hypothetical protein